MYDINERVNSTVLEILGMTRFSYINQNHIRKLILQLISFIPDWLENSESVTKTVPLTAMLIKTLNPRIFGLQNSKIEKLR